MLGQLFLLSVHDPADILVEGFFGQIGLKGLDGVD